MNESSPSIARSRKRDADRTKAEILEAAQAEFAENGYSGARVDAIATATSTTKRMIYYYFTSKEGLYLAVLERAYAGIRALEQELSLDALTPVDALRELAARTYDHHSSNEAFIRLVAIENIHRAEYLRMIESKGLSIPVMTLIEGLLERGRRDGTVRDDVTALDVHQAISAQSVFAVANRHTFEHLFGRRLLDEGERARFRVLLGDMIAGLVAPRSR